VILEEGFGYGRRIRGDRDEYVRMEVVWLEVGKNEVIVFVPVGKF
jgi:hypothetical protein